MAIGNTNKSSFGRFMAFEDFITVKFIRIFFVIGLVLIFLTALGNFGLTAYQTFTTISGDNAVSRIALFFLLSFATLIGMIVMMIGWRLYCELIVVMFRINDNLQVLTDIKVGESHAHM